MPAVDSDGSASRRRGGALAGLVIAASVLVAGAIAAAPADAAGPKHPRVIAVTASDAYLVYRQKTGSAYDLSFPKGSALHAVGADRKRHAITGFDPEGFPTLQASTLVQSAGADGVRWQDLRTGAKGVTAIPGTDALVGAAPGGWIATRTVDGATHVLRYTTAGAATDLGVPIPAGTEVRVVPGPKGVVVASKRGDDGSGAGRIRALAYRAGTWRTLLAAGTGVSSFCREPSSTHVVCEVGARPGKHAGTVLLALNGTGRAWLDAHPRTCQVIGFVTVGRSAVGKATADQGRCVQGRLTRLGADGSVTQSMRLWGAHASGITDGLGGLLIDSVDQRRIVMLDGVHGTQRTVVTAS